PRVPAAASQPPRRGRRKRLCRVRDRRTRRRRVGEKIAEVVVVARVRKAVRAQRARALPRLIECSDAEGEWTARQGGEHGADLHGRSGKRGARNAVASTDVEVVSDIE